MRANLQVLKEAFPTLAAVHVPKTHLKSTEQRDITSTEHSRANGLKDQWIQRRGHTISFVGPFVFTFLVYFRPYELFPLLSWLSKSAMVVALITIAAFLPAQLCRANQPQPNFLKLNSSYELLPSEPGPYRWLRGQGKDRREITSYLMG